MNQQVVPMLHVPDLPRTIAFYESIGFRREETYEDECEITFAIVRFGGSIVMLNGGGHEAERDRRDVDLYVYTDPDELYLRLKDKVEIVADLNDTFYGNREFAIRDINGFWITFGMPISDRQR
ncbi:MAG TPA: VOC family protein [Allosphingosinicella sp.]|jgi:uncharacterized glyoxalase superfamily protein PhnB